MTIQDEYVNAARRSQDAWISAAESWTQILTKNVTQNLPQNLLKAADQPRIPFAPVYPGDATAAVEEWFGFAGRLMDANHEYAKNLAGVANAFTGAVRTHVDSVGEVIRDQAQAQAQVVGEVVRQQAQTVGEVVRDQAQFVSDTAQEQARQAEQTEREQARQSRQAARERYEGLTKAELIEKLGERDLPKTGNVEDLIERLVDADIQH